MRSGPEINGPKVPALARWALFCALTGGVTGAIEKKAEAFNTSTITANAQTMHTTILANRLFLGP